MLRILFAVVVLLPLAAEEVVYKDFNEAAAAVAVQVFPCLDGFPDPESSLNTYMEPLMRLPGSKTGALITASVGRGGINGENFETGLRRFDADIVSSAFTFAQKNADVRLLARNTTELMVESFLARNAKAIPVIMASGAELRAKSMGVPQADIKQFKTKDFNIFMLTGEKPVMGRLSVQGQRFYKDTNGAGPLALMVYEMLKGEQKKSR